MTSQWTVYVHADVEALAHKSATQDGTIFVTEPFVPSPRGWLRKFADAAAGIAQGMRGQNSFVVHLTVALLVIVAAAVFQVTRVEWCLLIGAIALVLAAELFNSALEHLAKAITRDANPHVARALDIAGGAVLVVSLGAAAVGLFVFVPHLLR